MSTNPSLAKFARLLFQIRAYWILDPWCLLSVFAVFALFVDFLCGSLCQLRSSLEDSPMILVSSWL